MEMIRKCLEVTPEMRAAFEAEAHNMSRKEMIANRINNRSETFGNRKEHRRQAAIQRQFEQVRK